MTIGPPAQAGFIAWVRAVMGITTEQLPDDSLALVYAYEVALAIVNEQINQAVPSIYILAVYNLGGDNLINWAQDPPDAPTFKDNLPLFAYLRKSYGINNFIGGIVTTASDQGTAGGIMTSDQLKNLTVGQLQNLKTPFGRQYLAFANSVGTLWGLS